MADMIEAKTILAQLGGRRFVVMTGATQFGGADNPVSLKFSLPGRGIHKVVITLDPSDTYTLEAYQRRGAFLELQASHSNIYAEDLQRFFTEATGLDTHL